jgi:hypothetical protein
MDQQFIELFDVSRVRIDPEWMPKWPEMGIRGVRRIIIDPPRLNEVGVTQGLDGDEKQGTKGGDAQEIKLDTIGQ